LAALPYLVERCGGPCMSTVTRWFTRTYARALTPEERRQLCEMNALPGTARAFARAVRDVTTCRGQKHNFLRRAREIEHLPAMALFWGENDRVIPIRHGEALCSALENCRLERFPAAGHFLHWERPAELAAALGSFFAEPNVPSVRLLDSRDRALMTGRSERAGIDARTENLS
jgi:pimeloyl-ACP methyl ester carboxylesterase